MFLTSEGRPLLPLAAIFLLVIGSSLGIQEVAPVAPSPAEVAALARVQPSNAEADADAETAEYEFLKRLHDYNVGKRAYSYVSEYKRLPVYNFGLGKRAPAHMYSFGLGKRSGANRMYSFGLGKRDYEEDYADEGEDVDISEEDNVGDDMAAEKRNRLYSFGLGKRMSPYGFGLGKRYPGEAQRMYGFGLGKRANPSMYSFGLGKRAADTRLYSFGLGKRPSSNRNTRFSFGLGKRSGEGFDDENDVEEGKRYAPDRRFSFGLGKREVSSTDLEEVSKEATKENGTKDHVIAKRSLHYGFGLGKRSPLDVQDEKDQFEDAEELSRFARRPYSFGLGKRIPMYDFGIGKRAEG